MMGTAQFTDSFSFSSTVWRTKVVGFAGFLNKTPQLTQLFVLYGQVFDDAFV